METEKRFHKPKRLRRPLSRILGGAPDSPSPVPMSPYSSRDEFVYLSEVKLKGCTNPVHLIMDEELAADLQPLLPPRLQLDDEWHLIYSMRQDGISLNTLYRNCDPKVQLRNYKLSKGKTAATLGYADDVIKNMVVVSHNIPIGKRPLGYIMVIFDNKGNRFGCYLNDYLRPADKKRYYGNGECFLWKSEWVDEEHKLPRRLKAFAYTGINDNIIYSNLDFIAIGSSSGNNGLWIDSSLCKGHSCRCETFGNEILNEHGEGDHKYGKFKIVNLEIWRVGQIT